MAKLAMRSWDYEVLGRSITEAFKVLDEEVWERLADAGETAEIRCAARQVLDMHNTLMDVGRAMRRAAVAKDKQEYLEQQYAEGAVS